jgi:hypothetical protein
MAMNSSTTARLSAPRPTSPDHWKRWVESLKEPDGRARRRGSLHPRQRRPVAEFYAKSGSHLVSLQKSLSNGETTQSSEPQLIALATAVMAKLR